VLGVLDWGGDRRRGRGSFGGEFVASFCNQWGLCCVVAWKRVNSLSCHLGGEWGQPRHCCTRWGSTCCKERGSFLGF